MSAIGSSRTPDGLPSMVAVAAVGEINASRPLPSAFLCMIHDLPRELSITLGARTVWIVENDRLAERRSFTQLHVARNHRLVDPFREELPGLVRDLLRKVEPGVEHREQDAFDPK